MRFRWPRTWALPLQAMPAGGGCSWPRPSPMPSSARSCPRSPARTSGWRGSWPSACARVAPRAPRRRRDRPRFRRPAPFRRRPCRGRRRRRRRWPPRHPSARSQGGRRATPRLRVTSTWPPSNAWRPRITPPSRAPTNTPRIWPMALDDLLGRTAVTSKRRLLRVMALLALARVKWRAQVEGEPSGSRRRARADRRVRRAAAPRRSRRAAGPR